MGSITFKLNLSSRIITSEEPLVCSLDTQAHWRPEGLKGKGHRLNDHGQNNGGNKKPKLS